MWKRKLSRPHDSVACKTICMTVWLSQTQGCGPLIFTAGIRSCTALLRYCGRISNQVEVWTWTGLLQHLDSFFFSSHFAVDFLLCFGSLSWCVTQLQTSFSCSNGLLNKTECCPPCSTAGIKHVCLVFAKSRAVDNSPTSPCVLKAYCYRGLVVCWDVSLQT